MNGKLAEFIAAFRCENFFKQFGICLQKRLSTKMLHKNSESRPLVPKQFFCLKSRLKKRLLSQVARLKNQSHLFIQHVWVFCEPHTQKLEGGHDHGVEVAGLEGSRTATLVHDVATYGADGSLPVGRVHPHLHLVKKQKRRCWTVCKCSTKHL